MSTHLHISKSPHELVADFTAYLFALKQGKDAFHIALSGGSTPQALFSAWAADGSLDWHNSHFYWGDERCVPPEHPDSNYGVARELFLAPAQIPAAQIHRILGEEAPNVAADAYANTLSKAVPMLAGKPHFDLIVLGMGTDGHTASVFPNRLSLMYAEEYCAVATHPESGQARVSLTGAVINHASHIAFLVTGQSKAKRIKQIIQQEAGWELLPASHVRPENGELHWFLDEEAAALL